jgi:hypothetical protein
MTGGQRFTTMSIITRTWRYLEALNRKMPKMKEKRAKGNTSSHKGKDGGGEAYCSTQCASEEG